MVYSTRRALSCRSQRRAIVATALVPMLPPRGRSAAETLIKTERNNFKEVVRSGQVVTQPVRSQDEACAESWCVLVDTHKRFWCCRKKGRAHRCRRDRRT